MIPQVKLRVDACGILCYSTMVSLYGEASVHVGKFAGKTLMEVKNVRVRITLECTECHQRNYNLTKEKKNHPERMETKKYCRFCQRHTVHKETK